MPTPTPQSGQCRTLLDSELYRFVQWRDYATTQALSNPIWVGWERLERHSRLLTPGPQEATHEA